MSTPITYITGGSADRSTSDSSSIATSVNVSGQNPFVLAIIRTDTVGGGIASMNAITCGGENMTLLASYDNGIDSREFIYYYSNPSAGSNSISCTFDRSPYCQLVVSVFSKVSSVNPINDSDAGFTVTSTVDNCLHVVAAWAGGVQSDVSITAGEGTIRRNTITGRGVAILQGTDGISPAGESTLNASSTFPSFPLYGFSISLKPIIEVELEDDLTMSEVVYSVVRKVFSIQDNVGVKDVHTIRLGEMITTSDTYLRLKRTWQNLTKNISTWINEDKS